MKAFLFFLTIVSIPAFPLELQPGESASFTASSDVSVSCAKSRGAYRCAIVANEAFPDKPYALLNYNVDEKSWKNLMNSRFTLEEVEKVANIQRVLGICR